VAGADTLGRGQRRIRHEARELTLEESPVTVRQAMSVFNRGQRLSPVLHASSTRTSEFVNGLAGVHTYYYVVTSLMPTQVESEYAPPDKRHFPET